MCRSIKVLYHFDPPASEQEVKAASLQFVRKISGYSKPSLANEAVFNQAVEHIANEAQLLLSSLTTSAPYRRELE